jgi:hypothetical protein
MHSLFATQATAKVKDYKPPSYNTVRGPLLQDAKDRLDRRLLPAWNERLNVTGCTICCDGWDATDKRPLLNVLAVHPKGAYFLFSVDTSGEKKDAQFIAATMIEAIKTVGPDKVVQVVTDNAQACKNAGKIIEES